MEQLGCNARVRALRQWLAPMVEDGLQDLHGRIQPRQQHGDRCGSGEPPLSARQARQTRLATGVRGRLRVRSRHSTINDGGCVGAIHGGLQ